MKEKTTKILVGITASTMLFAFTAYSKKNKIQNNNSKTISK